MPLRRESVEPEACTPALRLRILKGLPFFSGLGEAEVSRLSASFGERGFEPGQIITMPGEPASRLYVVTHGNLVILRPMPSGQDVLLALLSRGDFFGSLAPHTDPPCPDLVRARTAGCLLTIPAPQFRRILESHSSVALKVLEITAERLRETREMIEQLSARTVEERIAHTLLRLAGKLGSRGPGGVLIQAPLSQEDLAAMTGTTPESVSRAMGRFRQAGWVETGRRWVRIRDPRGLGRAAGTA